MPHESSSTPSTNDGSEFHMNIPISELIERDTRAIEASIVNSTPLVVETEDGVTHETRSTPIKPQGARVLEPPDPRSRDQGSKDTREGPKATSHQTEPRGKKRMSLSGLCLSRLEADKVISSFSFDPSL